MTFSIKANVNSLRKATRRALDTDITATLGGQADDATVDGIRVWRKFGDVEILDNTTSKVISGEATPKTVAALYKVLKDYGCAVA